MQRTDVRSPRSRRAARRGPVTPEPTVQRTSRSGPADQGQPEHLLAATGELARALLAGRPTPDVLQLIATRAREGTTAALALVGLSTDGNEMIVNAAAGPDSDRLRGQPIHLTPLPSEGLAVDLGGTPGGDRRVLVLLGLPVAGCTAALRAVRVFAEQAASTLELADQRAAAERERLRQDRHRTASGLLELVVPGLFATGLRLAGADGLIHDQPDQASARLRQAVNDLDLAISQVRTAALRLRAPQRAADIGGAVTAPASPGFSLPDRVAPLHDVELDQRHLAATRMTVEGPDRAPDRVKRQGPIDPLPSLPWDEAQVAAALDAVLLLACASCPSCLAVSLTLDPDDQPVTITAIRRTGHRHAPSLTVRLPRPGTNGPARGPAVLIVFASDQLALAGLADDIAALLETDPRRVTLAASATVPHSTTAGLVLAGQLAERAAVNRALGVLLGQGWLPTESPRELQRRADDAGTSLAQAATTVLGALPAVPPRRPS